MQAISPPYQHQFAELVGMLGEDILRITVGNRYRLRRRGKKLIFAQNQLTSHYQNSTANNGLLFAFLLAKTLTALALLKNGVPSLANIARRPGKLAAKKRRKVVTVAETAAIGDIRNALIAMA